MKPIDSVKLLSGVFLLLVFLPEAPRFATSNETTDCVIAQQMSFSSDFNYMSQGDESCRDASCTILISTWKESISAGLSSKLDTDIDKKINIEINRALSYMSAVSHVRYSTVLPRKNLIYLVVDELTKNDILDGKYTFISPYKFNENFLPTLSKGICMGNFTSIPGESSFDIVAGIVFIPPSVVYGSDTDLQKCVLEETYNGMGLFRDPPNQASLFDNKNYDYEGGEIKYSQKSMLMIRLLYELNRGLVKNLNEFTQKVCSEALINYPQ